MVTFEIFDGLSKRDVNRIFELGVICPVGEGRILFHKGDIGREIYVILTGKVAIVEDYETETTTGISTLAELGPGELFGEMAVFEGNHERSAHALVKEPSQVLLLTEDTLKKFIEKKVPRRFLINVIATLCHRLRLTNKMYMCEKCGRMPEHS